MLGEIMGVLEKSRRKIVYGNKKYIWYIAEDNDSPYRLLNIISGDKKFILSLSLDTDVSYVISKGRFFQGNKSKGGWDRYLLPFSIPTIITPKFVADIISWATEKNDAVKIEWNGQDIMI